MKNIVIFGSGGHAKVIVDTRGVYSEYYKNVIKA